MIGLYDRVSATEIASVASRDPQFRVPRQPTLIKGLVFIPIEGGLLVDGTAERQIFRGRGTQTLLPELFPLLDGRHTVTQIADRLPDIPVSAIEEAIALLYSRGILEEGAQATDPDWCAVFPDTAQFFHRHIDVTRVHSGAGAALEQLGTFRILLLGEAAPCGSVAEQLALCGLQLVTIAGWADKQPWPTFDLAVVPCIGGEARRELRMLDDICARRGVPWLRTALFGTKIEIGPRFQRAEVACYRCYERLHESSAHATPPSRHQLELWASLVTTEIVMLASRLGELASGHSMLVFDTADWSLAQLRPVSSPRCRLCARSNLRGDVWEAAAYEQAVTSRSKQFLSPKAHQIHHRAIQRRLREVGARYRSSPEQALPEDEDERRLVSRAVSSVMSATSERLDLRQIAQIVRRGVGYQARPTAGEPAARRWAPSAGNLGSPQVYLVATGVIDLPDGVYYYDAVRDVLALLRAQDSALRLRQILAAAAPDGGDDHACWLVLTAALGRLRAKYGPLGYRLAHLDAGVAIAQMEAVAHEAGITWITSACWPDSAILEELKLDPRAEPVTAVAAVSA